jgi:hypothetical protein
VYGFPQRRQVLQQLGRMILEVRKVTQNGKLKRDRDPQQWFIHLLAKNFHLFGDRVKDFISRNKEKPETL